MTDIKKLLEADASLTEEKLKELLSCEDKDILPVVEAASYSVFAGGKRIRPALVIESAKMLGGDTDTAAYFAAAVEMIHTYSLIHDDLPCMDNDELRRGRPTCHVVYGEGKATLAGDTLLTLAFGALASAKTAPENIVSAVRVLSECAGFRGMIGGQVMDITGETVKYTEDELRKLHLMKTGAMIKASVLLGALAAGVPTDSETARDLCAYAENIGLAFQIIDDVLDCIGDEKTLGKRLGNDAEHGKNTFVSFYATDDALALAQRLTDEAVGAIKKYENSQVLCDIALYLAKRTY